MAGGVVGDDAVGDALLGEFPGGEGGALAAGAGFVAPDLEFAPGGVGGVEGGGGAADIDEGEPAGVAMGEDGHAVADEPGAVFAELAAMADVLVGEFLGGGEGEGLFLGDRFARGERGADLAHRVHRVNGGGPGVLQGLIDAVEVGLEGGKAPAAEGPGTLGEPVGGGGADRAGAADHHVADGGGGGPEIGGAVDLEVVREEALLDQEDFVGRFVKSDGAVVPGVPGERDVH